MIEIRPLEPTPEGFESAARLLRSVFSNAPQMTAAYLEWNYRKNPCGDAIAYNAWVQGKLVGHFAVTPLRARVHGVEEAGLEPQHAVTEAGFEGRGIFKQLAERCFDEAQQRGFRCAVCPSNHNSTFAFTQRLAFRYIEPLDVRIGVGPLPRGSRSTAIDFERLWDLRSLAWRLSRPDRPYRIRRGPDEGVIYADSGLLGIPVELGRFPSALLDIDLPPFRTAWPLRAWIGLDPGRHWGLRAYLPVAVRLRPAPLNFIFRDLSGEARSVRPGHIRARMLDYDPY